MKEKFIALLTFTSSLRNFGTKFIRAHYLSILPNLLISELHGTLSRHVFEETAERSLIFKHWEELISNAAVLPFGGYEESATFAV